MEKLKEEMKLKRWHFYAMIVGMVFTALTTVGTTIYTQSEINYQVRVNTENITEHKKNIELHIPLKEMIKTFVTREEVKTSNEDLKQRLLNIEISLREIEKHLRRN